MAIPAHLPIRNSRKFYLTCNMAGRFTALYMNLKGRIPENSNFFFGIWKQQNVASNCDPMGKGFGEASVNFLGRNSGFDE